VLVSRIHLKNDVHMYPYKAKRTDLLKRAFKLIWGRGKRD
jgi:hypothetical protein